MVAGGDLWTRNSHLLGSIGFAYPEWADVFYPPGLPAPRRLEAYAERFPMVELGTTFYGVPSEQTVERWASSVPADFLFALKAPRTVTHDSPGLNPAHPDWRMLSDRVVRLGSRRTLLLIQLPPTAGPTALDSVLRLADSAPDNCRTALEVRRAGWKEQAVLRELESRRITWVHADLADPSEADRAPAPGEVLDGADTSDLRWVRLCGRHDAELPDGVEQVDVTERLRWWVDRFAADPRPTLWTVGNSLSGFAVPTLHRLADMLGVRLPSPVQPGLFDPGDR